MKSSTSQGALVLLITEKQSSSPEGGLPALKDTEEAPCIQSKDTSISINLNS